MFYTHIHTHRNTFGIIIAIVELIKYKIIYFLYSCSLSNFSCLCCLCKFVLYYCGTNTRSFTFCGTSGNPIPPQDVYRSLNRSFFLTPRSPYFQACVDCASCQRSPRSKLFFVFIYFILCFFYFDFFHVIVFFLFIIQPPQYKRMRKSCMTNVLSVCNDMFLSGLSLSWFPVS